MLLTRAINEFLHSSYTVEQVAEWDDLWFTVFDALVTGLRAEGVI